MPKSTASIENYPLLASDSVSWSLRAGTAPVIGSFDMVPEDARALFNNGARKTPVTLYINPPNGNPVKVTNLWILNIAPGPNPFISTITLADRRWFWSYARPVKRYNMRRRVGNKIAIASDQAPQQLNQSIPNYFFWPWSINQGTQWTARQAFNDVMTNSADGVLQKEMQYWGQMAPFTFDTRLSGQSQGLPIEDLQIDDQGDAAVGRMTKYLPESEVTVDYDGTVIVFSRTGGDEASIYQAILPEIPGGGHAALVSNAAIRPSQINVKFTLEVEVRFDAIENQSANTAAALPAGSTVTANPNAGQIQVNYSRKGMQNVLPSVDYQLSVNGNTIPMGTYIFFDDALNSWGNLPVNISGGGGQQLDYPLIQRAFVPWLDLWEKLAQIGQQPNPSGGNPSPWVERIAAVQQHYRTTYRLPSAWTNQFFSFRASRVATIDPQSGMRGPSLAYCDYCLINSQRNIFRNASAGSVFDVAQNRSGYPQSGIIDKTATPSPAYITVLDQDQGIIHINYRIDFNRMIEKILPSQLNTANNSMPTTDISNRSRAITFDTINQSGGYASLSPSFKFATILTCIPASPNNANQLFTVTVKPSDVQGVVPQGQTSGLLTAYGPQMDIHCGLDTARVMWLDSRSTDIEAIFGIQNGQAVSTPLTPNLQGLVVNIVDGSLTSGASLTNLAQAEAARVYAALADHYEGTVTGGMNGNVHLNGMMTDITHKLDPNGVTTTQLTMPSTAERMSKQIDIMRFLNSTSRAVIMKPVQPQAGA